MGIFVCSLVNETRTLISYIFYFTCLYLSQLKGRRHLLDMHKIVLTNEFFSNTAANLTILLELYDT